MSTAPWFALGFVSLLLLSIPLGEFARGWITTSAVFLVVVTLVVARAGDSDRWRRVTIWPVAVVLSVSCLSIATSEFPGLALERSAPMALFFLLVPVVQVVCWSPLATRSLGIVAVVLILVVDGLTVSDLIARSAESSAEWRSNRISGPFGNPNDLALVSLLVPLAALALAGRLRFIGTILLAIAATPAWTLSLSRQAAIGWLVAVASLARPGFRTSFFRRSWALALVIGALATMAMVLGWSPQASSRAAKTLERPGGGRVVLYAYGLSLAKQHPITGIGPSLFGEHYVRDAVDGWTWRDTPLRKVGMPWVHSLPLEILVETGVVGVAAFGALALNVVRRLRYDQNRIPHHRQIAWVASSGLIVVLVVGIVDLSFIKAWCGILIWTFVGLAFAVPARPVTLADRSTPAVRASLESSPSPRISSVVLPG